MRLIKLTTINGDPILINIECIGHIYRIENETPASTRVGMLTHNNGGFKVKEFPEKILKLIEASRGV